MLYGQFNIFSMSVGIFIESVVSKMGNLGGMPPDNAKVSLLTGNGIGESGSGFRLQLHQVSSTQEILLS